MFVDRIAGYRLQTEARREETEAATSHGEMTGRIKWRKGLLSIPKFTSPL